MRGGLISSIVFAADYTACEGSIPWLRAHYTELVGERVTLDVEMVAEVASDHIVIREPMAGATNETLFIPVGAAVKRWQHVQVTFTVAQAADGGLLLDSPRVCAYVGRDGGIVLHPLPKSCGELGLHLDTLDVTLDAGEYADAGEAVMLASTESTGSSLLTPLAAIKQLPDGTRVEIRNKWIAGADPDSSDVWLEEADRSAAIRVEQLYQAPNQLVSLTATIDTINGERVVTDCIVTDSVSPPSGFIAPPALGMPSRAMWGPNLPGDVGLSTVGRLVTVCGKATWVDTWNPACMYIALDDGSDVPVRVDIQWAYANPPDWLGEYVRVTGISDVIYRTPQDDEMEWNGASFPACWCRRVVCDEETDVIPVDELPSPTGAPASSSVSGHLICAEAMNLPTRIYTTYGHAIVQPEDWSYDSLNDDYRAPYILSGVPRNPGTSDAGLVSAKAVGYGAAYAFATPGATNVDITLDDASVRKFDSVNASPRRQLCGEQSQVTAHLWDAEGYDMSGFAVYLSVTGGEFTYISDGQLTSSTTAQGITSADGSVQVGVTRDTPGKAMITVVSALPGGGEVSENASVRFYDPNIVDCGWPMFQHDIAHTGVTGCGVAGSLQKKWHKVLASGAAAEEILWSSPVVADGIVYVGTNSSAGDLYAFDAEDGDEIAHVTLGSPIHGTPCISGGVVYVGTHDGRLHARYADTLQPVLNWDVSFSGQYITGSPVVYDAGNGPAVYIGTWPHSEQGYLRTIDIATGTERNYALMRYKPDYTTPAIDEFFSGEGRGYISDFSCCVTAVRCDTGMPTWPYPGWKPDGSEFYSSPTICDLGDKIYVCGGSKASYIYRITDAGDHYSEPDPVQLKYLNGAVNSTLAVFNGKLYFGSIGGSMYCVDAESFSQPDWVVNLGSPVTSSALISAPTGALFTCTENGVVHALSVADGSPLWSFNTSADLSASTTTKSSPAASNGKLYVVVGNSNISGRYLYCFGP